MEPVFIIGLYKCGTSWLLSVLCAHPQVVGLGEIDIVMATCDMRLTRRLFRKRLTRLAPVNKRLAAFFGRSAWCRLPVDAVETLETGGQGSDALRYDTLDAAEAVALFHELRDGPAGRPEARRLDRPQRFFDLPLSLAAELYDRVRSAGTVREVLDAMVEVNCATAGDASRLVFKGADQVRVFGTLNHWQPRAPKLAIVRDGRDAAISAIHYCALMKAERAPWWAGDEAFATLVKMWAKRAGKVLKLVRTAGVDVICYEDLTLDFPMTLARLLARLGLEHTDEVVRSIEQATSFERLTGRRRGEEARHVLRKGVIREWVGVLDDRAKDDAWRIAGKQLTALGYTRDGELQPLSTAFADRAGAGHLPVVAGQRTGSGLRC